MATFELRFCYCHVLAPETTTKCVAFLTVLLRVLHTECLIWYYILYVRVCTVCKKYFSYLFRTASSSSFTEYSYAYYTHITTLCTLRLSLSHVDHTERWGGMCASGVFSFSVANRIHRSVTNMSRITHTYIHSMCIHCRRNVQLWCEWFVFVFQMQLFCMCNSPTDKRCNSKYTHSMCIL